MSAALNTNGKAVNIGDGVSVQGSLVSFTGSGPTAQVTVQTEWSVNTFVAQAKDMQAVDHENNSSHPCTSISGKHFGVANELVTVLGKVTAISGSGQTALLTITLTNSGSSVQVPSGACNSDNV